MSIQCTNNVHSELTKFTVSQQYFENEKNALASLTFKTDPREYYAFPLGRKWHGQMRLLAGNRKQNYVLEMQKIYNKEQKTNMHKRKT